jgi:uncharacterized protein (TIGR02231 family)
MRRFFFACLLGLGALPLFADNRVSPKISEVTVYRSGAKLSSTATVRLPAGKSDLVFENLSPFFDPNSLQVRVKGPATLLSAVFQLRSPGAAPENPRMPTLRDSLVLLGDEFTRIRDEREVLNSENTVIASKLNQIGTKGEGDKSALVITVIELQELSNFYRRRLMEIKTRLLDLSIRERKTNALVQQIQQTMQRLQPQVPNQTGEIVLKMEAEALQAVEVTCTYLVTQASWTPRYDLRSEGFDKPLRLVYKAAVRNSSGFDWNDVRMHLSTANPLMNNNRPILTPLFVDFRPLYAYGQGNAPATEQVYNLAQARDLKRAAKEDKAGMDDEADIFLDPEAPLVSGDEFITNFDLRKPQDIKADGEENIVTVDEQDMPAEYAYHAVPKLDPSVFLLAKIADYGKYNLLPGQANIFYQDTYVGQTTLNPNTVADTLLLSLGRDEQISIKRVQPKDFTERKKVLSNSIKESFVYEIAVKNNKAIPIRIEIIDQIPVSKQAEIEVELEEKSGAEYLEDFGKLRWNLEVPPNQNKRLRFGYTIKYPKNKPISLQR